MNLDMIFKFVNRYGGIALGAAACLSLMACGDDDPPTMTDAGATADAMTPQPIDAAVDAGAGVEVSYDFASDFVAGASSVGYSGQVLRQVLIAELSEHIEGIGDAVDTAPQSREEVLASLLFYYDFDSSVGGETPLTLSVTPPLLQKTFNDISTDKQLRDKTAGNDASTDHATWNDGESFQGWSEGGDESDTPTELLEYWFGALADLAVARGAGTRPSDPDDEPIELVYVTAQGQDLKQLIQKFLLVSVTFSQGADDYLDDDVAGKGLLSPNTQDGDAAYSVLEHAWDEGFGYFGAARNYDDYTVEELSGESGREGYQSYQDTDADGAIDLTREYNYGIAVNCAKRDLGSAEATDFSGDVFKAFVAGRTIIANAAGESLSAAELEALKAERDIARQTWEKCVAATVVHYINEVLGDMDTFGTDAYSFVDHAKHWSEMKGYALGLQFNPASPMLVETRFADLHGLIYDAPVLPNDAGGAKAFAAYRTDLGLARDLLRDAYGFAEANVAAW